jgi:hypothetical protein
MRGISFSLVARAFECRLRPCRQTPSNLSVNDGRCRVAFAPSHTTAREAQHHFSDPDWEAEPIAIPAPLLFGRSIGTDATIIDRSPLEPGFRGQPLRPRLKIKLGDGKERTLQPMLVNRSWHPDAKSMCWPMRPMP